MCPTRAPTLLASVVLWKLPSSVTGQFSTEPAASNVNRDQTALMFLFETLSRLAEALETANEKTSVAASAVMMSLLCVRMWLPFDSRVGGRMSSSLDLGQAARAKGP